MNRPAGVTVSAVLLIIGSILTALMGVAMFLARSVAPPGTPQPPFYDAIMIASAAVFLGFAIWEVLAAIGLFQMRRWARISILVIGALLVIIFGFSLAIILFVLQQMPELKSTGRTGLIVGVLAGIYLIPILLGVWWLIYFNRARVKAAFVEGRLEAIGPTRPLSVVVIAWHLVAFAVLTPIALWLRFPAMVMGVLLTGWAAASVYGVYAVVELLIGIGLLRLKPWSLNGAVWLCIYFMLNSIVFAFVPNASDKMLAGMRNMFPEVAASYATDALPDPKLNAALGVMIMALPLYYLVTRRRAFLDAGKRSEIVP